MTERSHWIAEARPPEGKLGRIHRLVDPDDLLPWLEDAAHYPGGHSSEVCFPTNEAEVAEILRRAGSVLCVGAQSSLTGGATPRGETLLSTARMAGVHAWKKDAVVVGPGLLLSDLQEALAERDMYYPPVPTYDGATVGGTVSTNAAGAATFKYGTTRDWVEALTVVLANGEVLDLHRGQVRAGQGRCFEIITCSGKRLRLDLPCYQMPDVPKCSAGYFSRPGMDLIDLFIGSEGTLAVVTRVELRLKRGRPAWFCGLVPLAEERAATALVEVLRQASRETWQRGDRKGIDVAAIEYMDARSLELLREDGVDGRLGLALPAGLKAAILLQAELPAGTSHQQAYDELARLNDPAFDSPLVRLCRLLVDHGVFESTTPALPAETARRKALFALREAVPEGVNRRIQEAKRAFGSQVSKVAADVIVPFDRFAESLARYRDILERRSLDYAVWGHISDGNVHPNVIPRSAEEMASAKEAILEIGQSAIDLGGSPASEHGTGRNRVKQELLRRLYGDAGIASMRAVKRALDPGGRLAPGVLFPCEEER